MNLSIRSEYEFKCMYVCTSVPRCFQDSDDDEFAPANVTFAPKDVTPIKFCGKADMHGLGYSGIRASAVSGNSGHINLFEPPAPAVSSTGRRGMTGAVRRILMLCVHLLCLKWHVGIPFL